ncbi:pilus assembly PilX family protein [Undibacterium sp. SXout11W]|uniref:pilus assembly PilX family protein n=1 Tax=Undibacterium sp. SXout11W TaxID=3413050 RepID=UPI003BEFF056
MKSMITKPKQQGSSLILALIVLTVLLGATIAMFRNADVSSMIAGNLAFRDVSVRASDVAIKNATDYLTNTITSANFNTDAAPGYYATQRAVTGDGIPCSLALGSACTAASMKWGVPVKVGTTQVFTVIDRLCNATPSADPSFNCLIDQQAISDSSKVGNSLTSTTISTTSIYYRVTVKVLGASNTESYVQVVIPKQI